jgi:GGDEF domain-containing protein
LRPIAFVVKQVIRETDFIARQGEEEFVAITPAALLLPP